MKPLLATLAVAIVLVAPACGAGASAAPPRAHPTVLRIVVAPGFVRGRHVRRYHLTCAAPAGNVPDPAAACRALLASPRLLAPMTCRLAPDLGAETVRGRYAGHGVSLHLSGAASCAARWHALAAALGVRA
jgi:hypothetical protein